MYYPPITDRVWEDLHHGDRVWYESSREWGRYHSPGRGPLVQGNRGEQEEGQRKQYSSPWLQSQRPVHRGQWICIGYTCIMKHEVFDLRCYFDTIYNVHRKYNLKFYFIVVQWRNPRFIGYYKRPRIKGKLWDFCMWVWGKIESHYVHPIFDLL